VLKQNTKTFYNFILTWNHVRLYCVCLLCCRSSKRMVSRLWMNIHEVEVQVIVSQSHFVSVINV